MILYYIIGLGFILNSWAPPKEHTPIDTSLLSRLTTSMTTALTTGKILMRTLQI